MSETVNIHETNGRSVTDALPKPIRNLMEDTRRELIAVRVRHGANTPIGHRCSNIIEGLQTGASPTLIAKQMAELARLLAGSQ